MVVNLWASWCGPCRRELPLYQAYAEKYAGKVDVVGIDFQETRPERAKELARETGVKYPLYEDPDGKLRAVGLPKLILLDAKGRVAYEQYVEISSVAQLEKLVAKHLGVQSGARHEPARVARAHPRRCQLDHGRGHQPVRAA